MTSTPQPSASASREAMEIVRRAVACICIHCEGGPCPGRCQPQRDGVALAIDALVSVRVEALQPILNASRALAAAYSNMTARDADDKLNVATDRLYEAVSEYDEELSQARERAKGTSDAS